MTAARPALPDWPAMMPIELAHEYLGVGRDLFLGLAARHQVRPVEVGARRSLWKRRDLDELIDRLPHVDSGERGASSSAQPPGGGAGGDVDLAEAALAAVSRSSARGRRRS